MKKLIKIKVFFLCLALLADYCHFSVLLCLFFKKRDHKTWLLTKKNYIKAEKNSEQRPVLLQNVLVPLS